MAKKNNNGGWWLPMSGYDKRQLAVRMAMGANVSLNTDPSMIEGARESKNALLHPEFW
jgi:hypothetical protein